MHDLPSQTLLQQANARPVSGEELEVFGKAAASRYMCGHASTLNDAVVETVKQAALSPEQVKRVVEFANTAAYLSEFKKEGASHKYIHFDGGPASPSEVLKDLNDGGGGTIFDRGMADYNQPPPDVKTASARLADSNRGVLTKVASVVATDPLERAFHNMWGVEAEPLPFADPWRDAEDMREKLATMGDNLNSDLSMLEGELRDITEQLYSLVKHAALDGVPLSHVVQAWSQVTPGEGFVKAAFSHIGPRLVEEEVFNYDGIGESLTKHASIGVVNTEHPLVGTFAGFCSHLMKVADVRGQRDVCDQEFNRIDSFIKKAANLATVAKSGALDKVRDMGRSLAGKGGAYSQLKQMTGRAGQAAGGVTQDVGEAMLGEGSRVARGAGWAVEKGVKHSPEIAAAVGAKELHDQVKYRPTYLAAKNVVQSRIPYTHPYMVREYQLQQNAGGMF